MNKIKLLILNLILTLSIENLYSVNRKYNSRTIVGINSTISNQTIEQDGSIKIKLENGSTITHFPNGEISITDKYGNEVNLGTNADNQDNIFEPGHTPLIQKKQCCFIKFLKSIFKCSSCFQH